VIRIDGHVHVRACFDPARFLDAAAGRLIDPVEPAPRIGGLLLSEAAGDQVFEAWRGLERLGAWRIQATREAESLRLSRADDDATLMVIAGRQIVTAERLEVLALCTAAAFADGLPLRATMQAVLEAGAVCVLPWGFGKWTGRRGALVREVIQEDCFPGRGWWLGDNGGRCGLWGEPSLFAFGGERGIGVLPGTDPLNLAREESKVGRYGFVLPEDLPQETPAAAVRTFLAGEAMMGRSPQRFGRLESGLGFIRAFIGQRLGKRG
jgi:hypothetical protein